VTEDSTGEAPHASADTIGTSRKTGAGVSSRARGARCVAVIHLALNVTLFVAAVFWLGVACWVYRDARRRSRSYGLVAAATLLGLVPVLGPLGYLLVRPPETRDEVKTRKVELEALQSWLQRKPPHCPTCRARVEDSFLVCPVCTTRLKEPCAGCSSPLAPSWLACPFCALSVDSTPAADLDAALTAESAIQSFGARAAGTRARNRQARAS
jgi:hypothetical protein